LQRIVWPNRKKLQRDFGYPGLRFMERDELETVLATRRYLAGLYDPNAGICTR